MKRLLAMTILGMVISQVHADTWVNGYTRSDGTYVQGHHRSSPNQYRYDNYSTQGNVNPWTGQGGTQNIYGNPSYGGSIYDNDLYNNQLYK